MMFKVYTYCNKIAITIIFATVLQKLVFFPTLVDMKIAFTGKGGSGKTTLSSLFAQVAADDGYRVLTFDADINQHMAEALGYSKPLRSMGTDADVIKRHLRGTNKLVSADSMHKTTPPGEGSQLVRLQPDDWFVREFTSEHRGVRIAGAGEIPEGNVGVRCYHGLNGAVELVLGHMIDRQDDVVVVDMTAGADAFSSSLFTKVDALVLVVEPTLKSLSVYGQFKQHMEAYDVPIVVVGNKVEDQGDQDFIAQHVGAVATWIPPSNSVRRRERGQTDAVIESEIKQQLARLRDQLLAQPIDWQRRQELSHLMHQRAVESPQIDDDFSLTRAAL